MNKERKTQKQEKNAMVGQDGAFTARAMDTPCT